MKWYAGSFALVIATFLCAICLLPNTVSANTSAWSSIQLTALSPSTGLFNAGNIECSYMDLQSRYITNETVRNSYLQITEQTVESVGRSYPAECVTQNDHGLMSASGLWSPSEDRNMSLPITNQLGYTLMPASGGSAVVVVGTANPGLKYSINHNLPFIGKLATRTFGTGVNAKKEKIFQLDTSKIDEFLSYSDGSVVRFIQAGFSLNGRFMVAQINGRGYVKIDLLTKELTPFSANTITNASQMYMTISNDGRYAATYKSGQLLIHDLTSCATSYPYGSWQPAGILPTVGCTSTPYFSLVAQQYPKTETVSGLRFSPNGSALNAIATWREQPSNLSVNQHLRLAAGNFTSSASGYLAMGDSFSSGEGDTEGGVWYEEGTDEQGDINNFSERNLCHLSRRSYPYLLAVETGYLANNTGSPVQDGLFYSVACSGAKVHNIIGGAFGERRIGGNAEDFKFTDNQYLFDSLFKLSEWQPGYEKQMTYTQGRSDDVAIRDKFGPEVITLSIGGNDVGFSEKLSACLGPGICEFATSEEKRTDVVLELAAQKKRLTNVYKKLKASAPDARIYVVGYPVFIQQYDGSCGVNTPLTSEERVFIVEATKYLNSVIAAAAQEAGVVYVDVENILDGTNLCSGVGGSTVSVNGVTAGNDITTGVVNWLTLGVCALKSGCFGNESFHPNHRAHELYALRLLDETQSLTRVNPEPLASSYPTPSDYFGLASKSFIEGYNNPNAPALQYAAFREMVTGMTSYRTPNIAVDGFMPFSAVNVYAESTPTFLGEFSADQQGSITQSVVIPESIEAGYHELHVTGFDSLGQPVEYYEPIILGHSEADFDGDGVLNEIDSCPVIVNSGQDIDEDGVDDACDQIALARQSEIEDEVEEEGNEEVIEGEGPVVDDETDTKGQPNPETVAGNEQQTAPQTRSVLGSSIVLGDNTIQKSTTLAVTGTSVWINLVFGLLIVVKVIVLNTYKK